MKKWSIVLAVLLLLSTLAVPVAAEDSYTYSTYTGETTYKPCPDPFVLSDVYTGSKLGVPLVSPKDLCFDEAGNLYVLDSELDLIYVFDGNMKLLETIDGFTDGTQRQTFNGPMGMTLVDGLLYICDTNNRRIVVLGEDRSLERIYTCPESKVLGENYAFRPLRIVVDSARNLYVINSNEYQGIMQFDEAGEFITFLGSDKVRYDPIELLWKQLMSDEQADQMVQFIPVEYTSISMDHEGFIYAVSAATGQEPIKRLNLSGQDVLNRYGYVDICGDIDISNAGDAFEPSLFTDITSNTEGVYFAVDSVKSRIFVYNREGYMLYAFTDVNNFRSPAAIELHENKLFITDLYDGSIAVYDFSDFGCQVIEADGAYSAGRFEESRVTWENVLRMNANYELAYAQIGRICLRNGEYEAAMDYFEKGNFRGSEVTKLDGYNKAFVEWRKEWAAENFGTVLVVAVVAVAAIAVINLARRRRE